MAVAQRRRLICESNLDPDAHANDGGMGLAQFQPGTWHDVCVKMNWWDESMMSVAKPSAFDPKYAIPAMGYYLRSLWLQWTTLRPVFDSHAADLGELQRMGAKARCCTHNDWPTARLTSTASWPACRR